MDELTLSPDYIARLLLKVRALMAQEPAVTPDPGGNAADDEGPATLQETPDDLTREELVEEIDGLDGEQQDALVALMWLGRDEGTEEDWEGLLETASERRETRTADYLLDHPLLAEYWASGLDALGYGSVAMDYRGR